MKRKYGCEMEEAYNKVEKLKHPRKHPTQEMQDAITDAPNDFFIDWCGENERKTND